jgi:putative spermidine/putrescine transport system substrate-binding protein
MRTRSVYGAIATISLIASACSGSATPSPSTASVAPPSATAPASVPASATGSAPAESATPAPSGPTPIASIGAGEGELDIVVWPGYAEDGTNVKEYDWVHPFEAANPDCGTVNVKPADTSDDMYTLMTQNHGLYDGVSASGDASNRLIDAGEISPIDPTMFPDFKDIADFLKSPPHNTVNGVHYGVSHGWGGNTLMYRTDIVKPAPTSWGAIFDPTVSAPYQGRITDYNGTIYIADAALYLKDSKPDLGITDPYELTKDQFDASVALLKDQIVRC